MPNARFGRSRLRGLLLATCAAAATAARGQAAPEPARAPVRPAPAPDTALVVLIPADAHGAVHAARVARAAGGRKVTAVYTTDDPAARRSADRLHARLGGSLINYDRVRMADEAFAGVLVENALEYAARREPRRAVVVVVEPGLVVPFLRRAAGAPAPDAAYGRRPDGFVIAVAPDDRRAVTRVTLRAPD